MSFLYLDANVSVKNYVNEPGTAWVQNLINHKDITGKFTNIIFTVEISLVEVAAAFSILQRLGKIRKKVRDQAFNLFFYDITTRYRIIPVTSSLLLNAAFLTQRYPLKGYDAVQLAAAHRLHLALKKHNIEMTLISGDRQLLNAAIDKKIIVDNPFDHIDI